MKRTVWAQRDLKDWDGFRPVAYSLDMEKVWALPVTDTSSGQRITFGQVVEKFRGQKVEVDEPVLDLHLKAESSELVVKGPSLTLHLLALIYELDKMGASLMAVSWYFYDHDHCTDDPHERYSFFLVAGDKIVKESVSLSDYSESGFDPRLLMSGDDYGPVWSDEDEWQAAADRLCYRRFYTTTRVGQLMVLRPDEPELYFYPEGRSGSSAGIEGWLSQIHSGIRQLKFAVWVLIVLTVLIWMARWR